MNDGTKGFLVFCGIASVIGALIGLGLSFTALSPLVIGGIVTAVPIILFSVYYICDSVKKGKFSKGDLFAMSVYALQPLQWELALLQLQLLFFLVQCLDWALQL